MDILFLDFLDGHTDLGAAIGGTYDPVLVALSLLIAYFGSFATIELGDRIRATERRFLKAMWLATGATAMGASVWAMHFVGMLAFSLPLNIGYNLLVSLLSVVPAVFAGGMMLYILARAKLKKRELVLGGIFVGAGIGVMHYTGMAAMRLDAVMRYDPVLFVASIAAAILLATFALNVKHLANDRNSEIFLNWTRIVSALIMGSAIAAMHYTAMTAVRFFPAKTPGTEVVTLNIWFLAVLISLITVATIVLVIIASQVGRRLEAVSLLEREISERKQAERNLRTLAETVSSVTGDKLFDQLTEAVAQVLDVDYAYIGELLDEEKSSLRTTSFFADGKQAENFEYDLTGTPCENVVNKTACVYDHDVQTAFPENALLRTMGVDSYVGMPLFSAEEEPLGVMAAMSRNPLIDPEKAIDLLQIFAIRAAVELERRQTEMALARHSAILSLLHKVTTAANEAQVIEDALQVCLDEVCEFIGWPVGHAYLLDETADRLKTANIWHLADTARFEVFRRVTEETEFTFGKGLPGRVWESGRPEWVVDVTKDADFSRAKVSANIGVKTCLASPVVIGKEVTAVIEFYSENAISSDGEILKVLAQIGTQLGRVIERTRAAEAIKDNETRFKDIASVSSDRFWEMDENLCFTDITGPNDWDYWLDPKELLGKTQWEGAGGDPDADENWKRHRDTLLARKPFRNFHYSTKDQNGHVMHWSISGTPVFGADGMFKGYRGSATDITQHVQAEEERDRALVQAEEANQAKSEFLATMSHELRTPLNAINGFSEMIEGQYFGALGSEKYKEYAADIQSSSEHLLHLVSEILDLSAIEAGRHSLEKKSLEMKQIAEECSRFIIKDTGSKGVNYAVEIPENLPPIHADVKALKQILLNLLSNAVKFTPERGRVSFKVAASNGSHFIEVRDTGKGIPPDKIPSLTEPFFRVETDPHKAQEGTGLGLAITKSLVDLHEGELSIKSKVDKGTTVTVTLPSGAP